VLLFVFTCYAASSEAKKVSKNAYLIAFALTFVAIRLHPLCGLFPITAIKQSFLSVRSMERRDQDPKWKTLSKIGNRNAGLLLLH
jgi:hypothetical protein